MMFLFTSSSCGECHTLLASQEIKDLERSGALRVIELHGVDENLRQQIFSRYSPSYLVPFLVYGSGSSYSSIVGRSDILNAIRRR
jgi:hypothetical protein